MDWARAIEINHAALTRIVAALVAMVGLAQGVRLPEPLYRAVARVLRPAESAVRRLIVIAARGLKVEPSSLRPMPKGLTIAGKGGSGRISFPLFDAPKRYDPTRRRHVFSKLQPRVRVISAQLPLSPLFYRGPEFAPPPTPDPDRPVDAQRLRRRLVAVKMALETLPRQALRLARWKARRDKPQAVIPKSPLRFGPPPGHRKEPKDEIDWVLKECHALARDVLKEDTS